MGNIIFKYGHDPYYDQEEKIDITNWRALVVDPDEKVVIFIIHNCDEILISDIAFDEVHEINYCNKTVRKSKGSIAGCWLPCKKCAGSGLTDWIAKTMRKPSTLEVLDFDRDSEAEICHLKMYNHYPSLYISKPKKLSTQEFCSVCHGSGLNLVKNLYIIDRFKIENC